MGQRLEKEEAVVRGVQAAKTLAAEATAAEKRGPGRPRRVIFAHNTQPRDILYQSERVDRGPAVQIRPGMSVTGVTTPPSAMASGAQTQTCPAPHIGTSRNIAPG